MKNIPSLNILRRKLCLCGLLTLDPQNFINPQLTPSFQILRTLTLVERYHIISRAVSGATGMNGFDCTLD